ncbi:MAG TPA: methyltransferase domain-containing protein [Baekduia sp.]
MTPPTDREEILARIAEVPHWHHAIPITPEITTPGVQHSAAMIETVQIPEDCTGMRVLDIGARDGLFSFEAERRGATEIVALDNVPPEKTGFAVAKELLGSKAEYVTDNVYNLSAERFGTFDLVFFFGVLYHLRHPLLGLDRIWDVCNDGALMYVETHMMDEGVVQWDGTFKKLDDYHPDLKDLPLVQFFPGTMLANDFTSKWGPSQVGLRGMLEAAGFDTTREWMVATRGGATTVARGQLDGGRAADGAAAWDLVANTIIKPTAYSPPVPEAPAVPAASPVVEAPPEAPVAPAALVAAAAVGKDKPKRFWQR